MKKIGKVIIPQNHPNPPEPHEVEAVQIVADFYCCEIEFIIPIDDYKRKTPDVWLSGVRCEIKSPVGNSKKNTVRKQFERASAQHAKWLIFDSRRTKLSDEYIISEIKRELPHRNRIKKVILITKEKFVIEIE